MIGGIILHPSSISFVNEVKIYFCVYCLFPFVIPVSHLHKRLMLSFLTGSLPISVRFRQRKREKTEMRRLCLQIFVMQENKIHNATR